MSKVIAKRRIALYLVLTICFYLAFASVADYYIQDFKTTPHPIDSHLFLSHKFFDADYVVGAKNIGYNIPHFFQSYFLLDLLFPIVYTFLFLSILDLFKEKASYRLLVVLIIAGCIFDYLENFTFVIFLNATRDSFAKIVALATAIKSVLFISNAFALSILILGRILRLWKRGRSIPNK